MGDVGEIWTFGLIGGGGEGRANISSHDVGRLLGEQSPSIHHSKELQVAMKHEGGHGY
jgi:hypothetical protein